MSWIHPSGGADQVDLATRLDADVTRVADRLRGLSLPRLGQDLPPFGTCADAGRRAAQLLAELAQGIEERDRPTPPSWRTVPRLADGAVGDQVAVTGHDAVAAVRVLHPGREDAGAALGASDVWTRSGRRSAAEAVSEAVAEMRVLRLAID